ncbi:hypothetical protein ACVIIZ_004354 [Bradyrhizobium sp. USDA 4523]
MQLADGCEKVLAARRAEHVPVIGVDIDRGRPRAAFAASETDAGRGRWIARHRHGRDLAEIARRRQPRDQLVRREPRGRAGLDAHHLTVQAGLDLILKGHRRAGEADHGPQQRQHEANQGMDLQQCSLDRAPNVTHQNFTVAESEKRRASPIATVRMLLAEG